MASLVVCPLSRLLDTFERSGADTMVTLMRRAGPPVPNLPVRRHLWLEFSDILEVRDGYTLPNAAHLDDLVDFVSAWERHTPLLLHCYAGVSRSTAAAFIAACALEPWSTEGDIAARLREASPTATPNARMIALADERLGRSGRMTSAISAIGRGADCFEGEPFRLEIAG